MEIPIDQTIRIADLFSEHVAKVIPAIIEDLVCVNCEIQGPAIIAMLGTWQAVDCTFDGSAAVGPEPLLWPVEEGQSIVGACGIRNALFEGCRFSHIGVAGTPAQLRDFANAFPS